MANEPIDFPVSCSPAPFRPLNFTSGPFAAEPTLVITEAESAADMKTDIVNHLVQICKIMDRLNDAGLVAEFAIGKDAFGKNAIARIAVARYY